MEHARNGQKKIWMCGQNFGEVFHTTFDGGQMPAITGFFWYGGRPLYGKESCVVALNSTLWSGGT